MNQSITIEQLTNDLNRIEIEIGHIRRELKSLPHYQDHLSLINSTTPYAFVNKTAVKKQMRQLFHTLSIYGDAIGVESLQKQMQESQLAVNELSQSIITAREE